MKLRGLEGYEIVFICDDSGSMNTPLGKLPICLYAIALFPYDPQCR